MNYRDTASFGKRQEFIVIAELLRRGFDIYLTLVDDKGIDCIIRKNENCYIDMQIKARSKEAKQWNQFSAMSFTPRKNYFFIFYTEKNNSFWIIPSCEVVKLGSVNKSGKNAGTISLILPKRLSGSKFNLFQKYKDENGFKLLEEFDCKEKESK